MDCGSARDAVQGEWSGVKAIWLDANATAVERKSIKPLIELLDEGARLNEGASEDARAWLEKARAL